MTETCQEYQVLLSVYASGGLTTPESERLRQHLAVCPACRSEVEQSAAVLEAIRLPPPTEVELRSLEGLPSRILASWNRSQRRRSRWRQSLAALGGAAAAAAVLLLLPATLHHQGPTGEPVTATAEWQAPDVGELWDASAVIEVGEDQEMALLGEGLGDTSWEDEY